MHPGTIVAGRWEILAPLGAGGMGDVYEARHCLTKAKVALKVVRGRGGYTAEAATRFAREASAPAAIGHPGIANVLDAGLDPQSGQLYLVTELFTGATLRAHLGPGALPLIAALLEPLAAAHAAGFVHRDLKPENVFVDQVKGVKLLDFGIARSASETGATGTGAMMGTPWYMAPEQTMSARDVTPAADSWSVGVMLYESMCGRLPFGAQSLTAHVIELQTGHHTPLSIVAPATQPALSALVDRCLDKDPARRPANAGALLRELSAIGGLTAPAFASPPADASADVVTAPLPGSGPINVNAATMAATPAVVHAIAPTRVGAAPAKKKASGLGCVVGAVLFFSLGGLVMGGVLAAYLLGDESAASLPDTQAVSGPGFTLEIPANWRQMEPADGEILLQYGAPVADTESGVRAVMSVWQIPSQGLDTATFAAESRQRCESTGGSVMRDLPATLSGIEGREVVLDWPWEGGPYVQANRVTVLNGELWLVTCSAARARFDAMEPTCLAMFDSVQLRE